MQFMFANFGETKISKPGNKNSSNLRLEFRLVEQPRDAVEYRQIEDHRRCPCLLATKEWKDLQGYLGWSQVNLNQGPLGHARVKPTTIGTNLPLQWLTVATSGVQASWTKDSEDSREWGAWAPGLVKSILEALQESLDKDFQCVQIKAVKHSDEEAMRRHLEQGHVPYWRRCRACVEGRSRDKRHCRGMIPDVNVLAIDLAGLFRSGYDERISKVKYMLQAVFVLPDLKALKTRDQSQDPKGHENPEAGGLQKPGATVASGADAILSSPSYAPTSDEELEVPSRARKVRLSPVGVDEDLGSLPERLDSEEGVQDLIGDQDKDDIFGVSDDEREEKPESKGPPKPMDDAGVHLLSELPVIELTFCEPLKSKASKEVLTAIRKIETRIHSLGFKVQRIHSDAGLEFQNKHLAEWAASRQILLSNTLGDNWRSNGRAERSIAMAKQLTRTHLLATKLDKDLWPLAWRWATEHRLREGLKRLGQTVVPMVPFGCKVYVRQRSWRLKNQWSERVVPAVVLAPVYGVPQAWVIRTDEGEFFATTIIFRDVLTCPNPPAYVPAATHSAQSPLSTDAPAAPTHQREPTRRIRLKTRLARLHSHFLSEDEHAAVIAATQPFALHRALEFLQASAWVKSKASCSATTRDGMQGTWGLFRHGGQVGLTNSMTRLPGFAGLLAAVIRTVAPGVSFTTVALFTQGNVGPHRDVNNIPNSNVLYPICLPKPGMYVWSQLQMGDQLSGPVEVRAVPGGELQAGQVRWLREREPLQLNAKSWHSAQVLGQSRVLLLVSYSLLAINKTTAEHKATLSEFGFVLPGPSANQLCLAISEDDADDAHQGGEGGMLEEGAHVQARHPPISKTWNHDSAGAHVQARHPPISKTWNHDSAFEARHPPISKTWNHDSAFEAGVGSLSDVESEADAARSGLFGDLDSKLFLKTKAQNPMNMKNPKTKINTIKHKNQIKTKGSGFKRARVWIEAAWSACHFLLRAPKGST